MNISKSIVLSTLGLFLVACGTSNEGKQDQEKHQEQGNPEIEEGPEFEKAKEEIENAQQMTVELTTRALSMYFCIEYKEKSPTEFLKQFPDNLASIGRCPRFLIESSNLSNGDEKIKSKNEQVLNCVAAIKELESKSLEAVFQGSNPFEEGMKQAGGECNAMMKKLEPYRKGR